MRILVISNFYPPHALGGYEQRCRDVVDGLRARGHEVEVLSSTYGVVGPVREGHVERRLPSRWDPRYGRPTRRKLLAGELSVNRAVREVAHRLRPELVSVWNLLSVPYSVVAAAQLLGLPVVLHIDDDWPLRPDPWMSVWSASHSRWAGALKSVLRPAVDFMLPTRMRLPAPGVHWAFVSDYRKRQHVAAGLAAPDSPVIPGGIPVDRFLGRHRADDALSRPARLLFVGALTPAKAPHIAVEAMARLVGGNAGVTLDVVGPRPDAEYAFTLAALVRRLGLGDRYRLHEPVPREDMPVVYAGHDILLFTSVGPEGFPLTILEAMAGGLAVVSTVTGGHCEVLRDGANALTCRAGDADDLARCVRCLLDRPELARQLAQAGQEMVVREFTLQKMVDRHEELFHAVAKAASRRGGTAA